MANRRQDAAVEQALYQSAVGGVRPVSKLFKLKRVEYDDQTGKKVREYEEIVTGTEEVYDTPSTTAQQFWLKNRLPRQWGGGEDLAPDGLATGVVELPAAAGGPPSGGASGWQNRSFWRR